MQDLCASLERGNLTDSQTLSVKSMQYFCALLEWGNLTGCRTLWGKSIHDLCTSVEWGNLTDCQTPWVKSIHDLCASSHDVSDDDNDKNSHNSNTLYSKSPVWRLALSVAEQKAVSLLLLPVAYVRDYQAYSC